MVRVCESNIHFPCVRLCIHRPSICLSRYLLLNHSTKFNQNCCITFPYEKGVQEQYYLPLRLFVRRPYIYSSRYLQHQSCYITSPHGKAVLEQYYFFLASIHPSSIHLSVTLSPPEAPGGIQANLLLLLIVRVCKSNIFFFGGGALVHPCVCRSPICPSVISS